MKNLRAIILLFIANSISGFAQGISMLAIPWYFTDILKDPALFSRIYGVVTFVSLFWGMYCGTLVDRFNRKHIFIGETLSGTFLLCGVAAWGFLNNGLPVYAIAGIFAITFFTWNIHYPALYAFVQEISDPKDYSRITSYLEIQGQLTTVMAGAIGAMLLSGITAGNVNILGFTFYNPLSIEKWAMHQVFLLDGITYFLSFLLVIFIRYTAVAHRYKENIRLKARFQKGISFLKNNPLLFLFGNAAYAIFVTTLVFMFVLNPNFVKNFLMGEANVFALGEAFFAIGAIISGIFVAKVFKDDKAVLGCIVMTLITMSCFATFVFARELWIYFVITLLMGLANSGSRIMRVTYNFRHIPNQVIGRTQSVFWAINVLFRLFFVFLFSLAFFVQNIGFAFAIFSLFCLAAAVLMIVFYDSLNTLEIDREDG